MAFGESSGGIENGETFDCGSEILTLDLDFFGEDGFGGGVG